MSVAVKAYDEIVDLFSAELRRRVRRRAQT